MHAKYEVSISHGSKVMAKIEVNFLAKKLRTDKQTDKKQYALNYLIRCTKKKLLY